MERKKVIVIAGAVIGLGLGVVLFPVVRDAYVVHQLVDKNIEARGGHEAWAAVESLRLTGTMELGQGLEVPFAMDQEAPDRMCFEYEFDGATAEQCSDGERGWKLSPFLGRDGYEPMAEDELREAVDAADPRGLLFDHRARGHKVKLLDDVEAGGLEARVLQVTLPSGAVRVIHLDPETGLERKMVTSRYLAERERRVNTVYGDWRETDGLLFPRLHTTATEGDDESHALVVKTVEVNPELEATRFVPPASVLAYAP